MLDIVRHGYDYFHSFQTKVPWTAYLAMTASGLVVESALLSVSSDSMASRR